MVFQSSYYGKGWGAEWQGGGEGLLLRTHLTPGDLPRLSAEAAHTTCWHWHQICSRGPAGVSPYSGLLVLKLLP